MRKQKTVSGTLMLLVLIIHSCSPARRSMKVNNTIDLAGAWRFQPDDTDEGVNNKWYATSLKEVVQLPGSMTTNGKGHNITVNTPWTGGIFDSSWFVLPQYAKYRQANNIKVPFWLQPVKYYKGAAWYQRTIEIPTAWANQHIELYLERSHWETTVWINDQQVGVQNSLSTAQIFQLPKLTPGKHQLTIRVDNRVKAIKVGENSHSISDHTQSNWNGLIGRLQLRVLPALQLAQVQLYPDVTNKQVIAKVQLANRTGNAGKAMLRFTITTMHSSAETIKPVTSELSYSDTLQEVEVAIPMGRSPLLWDEFHPALYTLQVALEEQEKTIHQQQVQFGMRDFKTAGTRFTINGTPVFLRGTLESAIFPLTGYPPTDTASWAKIFRVAKSYGLNHIRFHSWCPPAAAFDAADRAGLYLQVECGSWANFDSRLGDGDPVDQYIYDESDRIVKAYGNHPSFCMLAYGNEPGGKNYSRYLGAFVQHWKARDTRRVYTSGAGWPAIPENEFHVLPKPRIQQWKEELKSIINNQAPRTNYDWSDKIKEWKVPVVSHEIGQWCVYPNFKEIEKYTGVLKPKNFEIFRESLQAQGLSHLADSFLLASGKLQALCYKADIEAALRTPGFGGFQLLDLHDFPGQGTALVGVLDPFWEEKGYITASEYRRFCNTIVPLARFPKLIYQSSETLRVPVELANFNPPLPAPVNSGWRIMDGGTVLFEGKFEQKTVPVGNAIALGNIEQSLSSIQAPKKLLLLTYYGNYINQWDFFVYPTSLPALNESLLVTQQLDQTAIERLNSGGNVLLTLKKGTITDAKGGAVALGFSSIFWNTAWTNGQAPHTLGILCDPKHPAFRHFPTDYHSNWQWWDAITNASTILLDSVAKDLQPVVRVIDDWVTNRSLGLIVECKVGPGKLLVSAVDLLTNSNERPEAKQLLYSLKKYMQSADFSPTTSVALDKIRSLTQ